MAWIYIFLIDGAWILATSIGLAINYRVRRKAVIDLERVRTDGGDWRDIRDARASVTQENICVAIQVLALAGGIVRVLLLIRSTFPETWIWRYFVSLVVVMVFTTLVSVSGIRNLRLRRVQQREHREERDARRSGERQTRTDDPGRGD